MDPYPDMEFGSGSKRAKVIHKSIKNLINFMFLGARRAFEVEGFLCSLDVLYGGIGICKL
jgi:hypothetical protein